MSRHIARGQVHKTKIMCITSCLLLDPFPTSIRIRTRWEVDGVDIQRLEKDIIIMIFLIVKFLFKFYGITLCLCVIVSVNLLIGLHT